MAELNWTASETEKVEPFQTSPCALDSTQVRLLAGENFDRGETRLIDAEQDWLSSEPQIHVVADRSLASRETGIPEDELSVGLVTRDRVLNSFQVVAQWNVSEVPRDPISLTDALSRFSRSNRLDICAYLFPSSNKDRGTGVASNYGQVLGRKIFKVRILAHQSSFPKRWASPEEFEERGLPRKTVFWIDWLVHDLNARPVETFMIWLNDQYRDEINSFQIGSKAGTLLEHNLAASILVELATAVLAADQESTDPVGTISIIADELNEVSGKSLEEMRQLFTEGHAGHSLVRAWVHEKLGVNEALMGLTFRGART